jgi:uncharacterized lipoprotein YehR (DUF1307 family)
VTGLRKVLLIAMAAALAVSIASCGKKARKLDPADGGKSGYPNTYPSSK